MPTTTRTLVFLTSAFLLTTAHAQHALVQSTARASAPAFTLFTSPAHDAALDHLAPNAIVAQLDADALQRLNAAAPGTLLLAVPYNGSTINVQLERHTLAGLSTHILTDHGVFAGYREGLHYRGRIPGVAHSLAAFSFFADHVTGLVSSTEMGDIVVGQLRGTNTMHRHVIYAEDDLATAFPLSCDVKSASAAPPAHASSNEGERSDKCVRIYYELMDAVFTGNGSDLQQTTDWLMAVHNITATVFANDGISIALGDVFIWTTTAPFLMQDPMNEVDNFADYRTAYNGDVAHCINTGGAQGAAYLANLCLRPYCGSNIPLEYEELPLYSITTNIIAHETGHVLGSPHTHDCTWNGNNTQIDDCGNQLQGWFVPPGACYDSLNPIIPPLGDGTIMSYCPGAMAAGFGPQPSQRMLDHIAAVGCLGMDCITSCTPSVDSLRAEDVTAVSARISFQCLDTSITEWEIRILGPNLIDITDWTLIDTTTFIAPWLLPDGWHLAEVRTNCSAPFSGSFTRYVEFYVPAVQCGQTITDSGMDGPWANDCAYPAITIMPSSPTDILTLTFSEFALEPNADHLIIYNGPMVGGPIVADLTGSALPAPVVCPTQGAALTVVLTCDADATNTYAGWSYTVSCGITTGVEENANANVFRHYPDPANELLNVEFTLRTAGPVLLAVLDMQGRVVAVPSNSAMPAGTQRMPIDVSALASGSYILRLATDGGVQSARFVKN